MSALAKTRSRVLREIGLQLRDPCPQSHCSKFSAGSVLGSFAVAAIIDIMLSQLEKAHVPSDVRHKFSTLLRACLENNICIFSNSIYKFPDGFPMSGPLSSLAAISFMDAQEQRFLDTDPFVPHIG